MKIQFLHARADRQTDGRTDRQRNLYIYIYIHIMYTAIAASTIYIYINYIYMYLVNSPIVFPAVAMV